MYHNRVRRYLFLGRLHSNFDRRLIYLVTALQQSFAIYQKGDLLLLLEILHDKNEVSVRPEAQIVEGKGSHHFV